MRTLSLQGGCDVDGYQEGDDRVEDASEYERQNLGMKATKIPIGLCAQWVAFHPLSRHIRLSTWFWWRSRGIVHLAFLPLQILMRGTTFRLGVKGGVGCWDG